MPVMILFTSKILDSFPIFWCVRVLAPGIQWQNKPIAIVCIYSIIVDGNLHMNYIATKYILWTKRVSPPKHWCIQSRNPLRSTHLMCPQPQSVWAPGGYRSSHDNGLVINFQPKKTKHIHTNQYRNTVNYIYYNQLYAGRPRLEHIIIRIDRAFGGANDSEKKMA